MPDSVRDYFLMPIPPTPNGRLHLGHIAGPYLRLDMLSRHLRYRGHRVAVISAIDGFDSYVLWKAVQEKRSPESVCTDYRALIAHDLALLDIAVDEFLDFVRGPHATAHADNARQAVGRLVATGLAETVTERVLYSRATGRAIVGAWLVGRCPRCDAQAAGYFCEACGAHFKPEWMVEPKARLGDAELEWRDVDNLFLRVRDRDALLRQARKAGAPEAMREIIERFLQDEDGLVRLTAPGDWGVRWADDRNGHPRVLFEAGWEYALTCGDRLPWREHPMQRNGGVTTIVSFGIDNAVLLLAGTTAVMEALPDRKPFDHVLTNHFYNLQGSKFSTSRGHVVWAADIVEKTPVVSDAVRAFLAHESPEERTTDFDIPSFISFVNEELAGRLQGRLDQACDALATACGRLQSMGPAWRDRLDAFERELDDAFRLDAVSVRAASRLVHHWIAMPGVALGRPEDAYGWVKGLACLGSSLMPRLALRLWHQLGHEGMPNRDSMLLPSVPGPTSRAEDKARFDTLTLEALLPCLPSALASQLSIGHA